jgi:hypothetical protein
VVARGTTVGVTGPRTRAMTVALATGTTAASRPPDMKLVWRYPVEGRDKSPIRRGTVANEATGILRLPPGNQFPKVGQALDRLVIEWGGHIHGQVCEPQIDVTAPLLGDVFLRADEVECGVHESLVAVVGE